MITFKFKIDPSGSAEEPHSVRIERERVRGYKFFTTWVAKKRRQLGGLRYFVASEFGDIKGRLHYHALIHGSADVITARNLRNFFPGHIDYKLAYDRKRGATPALSKRSRYVAKYSAKGAGRKRASLKYGAHGTRTVLGPILGDWDRSLFANAHISRVRVGGCRIPPTAVRVALGYDRSDWRSQLHPADLVERGNEKPTDEGLENPTDVVRAELREFRERAIGRGLLGRDERIRDVTGFRATAILNALDLPASEFYQRGLAAPEETSRA